MNKKLSRVGLSFCAIVVCGIAAAVPAAADTSTEISDAVITLNGYTTCLRTSGIGSQATMSNAFCNRYTVKESNGVYTINNEYGNCLYVNSSDEVIAAKGLCSFSNSHETWQEIDQNSNLTPTPVEFKNQFSGSLMQASGSQNGSTVSTGTSSKYNSWNINKVY